ncbi:MAG: excinuclease ABC subunit UvrC [Deltaproteobacteria bacterium]|nr:MAG: excinuclease ABC subunit UvrC [Deltaproteobacteria bacterium]
MHYAFCEPEMKTPATLQNKLDSLPSSPGVYLMKDSQGKILYVGKGKELRKRVLSYFREKEHSSPKIRVLVEKVSDLDFITTGSEKEALILESNLIKHHRPRYNVVLRDDKRYLVLRLDPQEDYPRLTLVRRIRNDGALYFGPYASAHAVRQTLKVLHGMFPLRQCSGRKFKSRQRPCLNHQMGRCLGLCAGTITPEEYAPVVEQAVLFLKGRTRDLQMKLRREMEQAADELEFEKAAMYRDRLNAVEKSLEKQLMVSSRFRDQDVIGTHEDGENLGLAVLFVREGRMVGSRAFVFKDSKSSASEIVRGFILQYYDQSRSIPEEILISESMVEQDLLAEWLSDLKEKRVILRIPKRGEGRRLLSMACQNAANYLMSEMPRPTDPLPALERLQQKLDLESFPHRLECVDISNFRGQFPVGSLVVFEDGEPVKSAYRRYRIRDVVQIDDPAMMAEVIRRRFTDERDSKVLPDLLVVDGGKARLNQTIAILDDLELKEMVPVVALAKKQRLANQIEPAKSDRLYLAGRKTPLLLDNDPPLKFLLGRLRDEAHRFAIEYYQKRHRKSTLHSRLDDIRGIGPKRRRALIQYFGSVNQLAKATTEEISQVAGVSSKLAEEIFSALKSNSSDKVTI